MVSVLDERFQISLGRYDPRRRSRERTAQASALALVEHMPDVVDFIMQKNRDTAFRYGSLYTYSVIFFQKLSKFCKNASGFCCHMFLFLVWRAACVELMPCLAFNCWAGWIHIEPSACHMFLCLVGCLCTVDAFLVFNFWAWWSYIEPSACHMFLCLVDCLCAVDAFLGF